MTRVPATTPSTTIGEPSVAVPAVALLIAGTAALRLVFAAMTGLGVDESYMVSAGRVLSLSYFDHPPAAWWLSWAAAHLAGSEAAVVVRLPFIALFAVSTWMMARIGASVGGARAGFWAAVLFNLSPVFGITTGTWVLPDGPLDCALLGAALCLLSALPAQRRCAFRWWCGAGACAGLALLSKYSAALTMAGAGLALILTPRFRFWLRRPEPYVAAAIATLAFLPVVAWNASHGWVSFAFQGGRAEGAQFHPLGPIVTLAGEALFVLPWIWAPMMVLWLIALREGPREWQRWVLCWLAAPPIIAFAAVSAWSGQRVLFHWAAPGYLMLFPILGDAVARRTRLHWVRWSIAGTAAMALLAVTVISVQLRFGWLHTIIAEVARKDPTPEGIDWTSLRTELSARGLLKSGSVVGVPNWRDTGKVARGLGPDVTVVCLNPDSRQFAYAEPLGGLLGRDLLILAPDHADRVPAELGRHFASIERLPDASVTQAGQTLQVVGVFRGQQLEALP